MVDKVFDKSLTAVDWNVTSSGRKPHEGFFRQVLFTFGELCGRLKCSFVSFACSTATRAREPAPPYSAGNLLPISITRSNRIEITQSDSASGGQRRAAAGCGEKRGKRHIINGHQFSLVTNLGAHFRFPNGQKECPNEAETKEKSVRRTRQMPPKQLKSSMHKHKHARLMRPKLNANAIGLLRRIQFK